VPGVRTQEQIAVGSSKLVEGLALVMWHLWPTKVKRSKVKATRSRNISAAIML